MPISFLPIHNHRCWRDREKAKGGGIAEGRGRRNGDEFRQWAGCFACVRSPSYPLPFFRPFQSHSLRALLAGQKSASMNERARKNGGGGGAQQTKPRWRHQQPTLPSNDGLGLDPLLLPLTVPSLQNRRHRRGEGDRVKERGGLPTGAKKRPHWSIGAWPEKRQVQM